MFQQIDEAYTPSAKEVKTLFGLTMEQHRNDAAIDKKLLDNVVSDSKNVGSRLSLFTFFK